MLRSQIKHIQRSLNRVMHPAAYQGRRRRAPYFEGWYFKLIDATEQQRLAIIPGVSLGESGGGPHSFVQVLNGATGQTLYQRYPVDAFSASETRLELRVGPNHFTRHGLELDLTSSELPLAGAVAFHDPKPWPVMPTSPGIMGWYAWVPKMECYHGVLSLDHGLSGALQVAGSADTIRFDGGRGYIEKDWGAAFPAGWVWMQTNHFRTPGVSLTASIARIPWLGSSFTGFIVGLLWGGTLYRFATYTGARTTNLTISEKNIHWTLEDALYRLTLVGHQAPTGALKGPSKTDMGRSVPETLSATVDVELAAKHRPEPDLAVTPALPRSDALGAHSRAGETILFSGTGRHAGMEAAGDLASLTPSPR